MILDFIPITNDDKDRLSDFLSSEEWPYHSDKQSKTLIKRAFKEGYYTKEGVKCFWINRQETVIGFLRIFELGENPDSPGSPQFDLRFQGDARGKGYGLQTVCRLVDYIFSNYPNKLRIEATTRVDNVAMRNVMEQALFQKEAHYRESWLSKSGELHDTVGYALLRKDWFTGRVSHVDWEG